MTRNQEIRRLLKALKTHLKTNSGDVKEVAAAYFSPPPPVRKKTTKKRATRRG